MASENNSSVECKDTVVVDGKNGNRDQETEPGNVSFGPSFDKLSLSPKKKLLMLCLGGLLVHRAKKRDKCSIPGHRPNVCNDGFFLIRSRGMLCTFLDGVAEAKDVPSYVEANPFDLPAVRASDPDWAYYSLIINKLEAGRSN